LTTIITLACQEVWIYPTSMGDADEVIAQLVGALRLLGASHAAIVEFVGDGAPWMWTRIEGALRDAGVPSERVRLVLDYYHCSEHLSDAIKACTNLPDTARSALSERLSRRLLDPDGPAEVLDLLRTLSEPKTDWRTLREGSIRRGREQRADPGLEFRQRAPP